MVASATNKLRRQAKDYISTRRVRGVGNLRSCEQIRVWVGGRYFCFDGSEVISCSGKLAVIENDLGPGLGSGRGGGEY
ncbi:hypothetical protein CEXT_809111 [Caerostris extrusa]|uniref:Uncharacterized protein n=1 Tax=Caerostris extrusa TaxID=172846 RepID=A0AAV4TZQ2_CAEEX|nr:hypothetical protein CEXT_809111 [Caerostris extrusa]